LRASCVACGDACLAERSPIPVACIRLNQDCAALCRTTAEVLGRGTAPNRVALEALLKACAAMSAACALECAQHGSHMAHCESCAEACRECEAACLALLSPAR
jgi:hypothetical protein